MRLFIANRIGTGAREDPFRPDVDVAAVGGRLGNYQIGPNRYLCVAPNATSTPASAVDLGEFPLERLSAQRLSRLATALGVDPATLQDMTIGEVLFARDAAQLSPVRDKVSRNVLAKTARWKIRVAGVDLYDAPVIAGGATDTFTYSNGALSTVSGGVWATHSVTGVVDEWDVVSNAVTFGTASGFCVSKYNTTFSTDHYSELAISMTAGEAGVFTRLAAGTLSGYYAYVDQSGDAALYNVTSNSFASYDTATGLATSGTIRLESIGSNHTVDYGGVEILSTTNGDQTGTSVAIATFATNITGDNWSGGEFSSLEQEGFLFRNDDGSETTATAKGAQDANVTAPLAANLRLRMLVNATGDPSGIPYRLDYKKSTDSVYIPAPTNAAPAPVVETTSENTVATAATNHPITLPTGIVETDEVLILIAKGTPASTATFNALTGWTELLDENVSLGLAIMRYTGAGVPSNPTFVSSVAIRSASIAYRISGADKTTTPQIGTTATGTSTTPDPPSVTPTGGVSKPYLFIAFFDSAGEEADDDTWVNTPPTNYLPNPPLQKAAGTAGTNLAGLIGAASRTNTSGAAENPGTFSIDASAAWRAQTIIVHPSTPPIFVSASANITAGGEATTAQLTPPSGKTTSDFTTGRMWDDENGTDTIDVVVDDYTELEWSLQAQSPAVNTDIYQFRVTAAGTALGTYTVTPEWTIGTPAGAPSASVPRRRLRLTYR